MPEYHFKGRATLYGVDFYITADTLEDAVKRAKRNECDLVEDNRADLVDWDIDETSGVENG